MFKTLLFFAFVISVAMAGNWTVHVGYGLPTPVPGTAVQWSVIRFFPSSLTIVAGDTVTWVQRNSAHSVTFNPGVLPLFKDNDNLFMSDAIFAIPANTGTPANPTVISNLTGLYSSGLQFQPGHTWTATFPTAATNLLYFCILHPDMLGSITVLPSGSTPPKTQAEYDADEAAELSIINSTADSLSQRVRKTPLVEPLPDGTNNITVDNGYGDRASKFSLNIFGPAFFNATVGDTITFILRDAMTGHTISFNGSNDFWWDSFTVLANGTIAANKFFYRSFGDNTNFAGQFVSGGILSPPGTPGASQMFTIKLSADLEKNYVLPRNFTFLCNIHTGPPPANATAGQRVYRGMVGHVEVWPRQPGSSSSSVLFCSLLSAILLALFAVLY